MKISTRKVTTEAHELPGISTGGCSITSTGPCQMDGILQRTLLHWLNVYSLFPVEIGFLGHKYQPRLVNRQHKFLGVRCYRFEDFPRIEILFVKVQELSNSKLYPKEMLS